MNPESCPNPDELRSFVRCNLSEQQADSISEHLDHCPACEETVVGLERDGDTIAERIKQAAAQPTFAHEPECQQLMQSLLDGTAMSSAESSSAEAPVEIAEILRDYQIVAKLGEGGMGAVYKAVHQRLKKTVALKVLPTNRIGDQPAVARFEREMEVLGQLNHPHIVQALDAGEHEGQHYLVMEYVEGCDLSDIVKRCSPQSVADACLLISQAAAGLQYAHEHGFVHRDIKPSNLMLATTGTKTGASVMVKILDLGLARALDQRPDSAAPLAELTTTGQVMGTLDYMAPEQGGDAHQVDIRADIYSLGATLYKLLTGDSPYAEHAQKPPLQRLMAIAQHEPPAIHTKRPEIPERLAAIVHRMLAKKPEQRFATPADVVQALAPFCAGADLAALVVPSGATRVLDSKTQSTTPLATATAGGGTKRRLRAALAGFAAFLALAAVIVISTRNGTVEVTAPDGKIPDDIKVVVTRGGEEVELLQAENQWSAKILNGEYQVRLRSGEDRFEVKDSNLTVTRLGRTVVTLSMKQPGVAPIAASRPEITTSDPDHRAAEYVLSIGGRIKIKEKYEEGVPATIGELPSEAFQLLDVHLGYNKKVSDAGLAHFQDCKNLRLVDLLTANVNDTGVAYLRNCKQLKHLSLGATKISDEGLAYFKHCKSLESLNLDGCKVGDEGLAHFQGCENLRQLVLGWTFVTDAGLAYFQHCQKLTQLQLHNTQVSDAGLANFKSCKNLTYLRLDSIAQVSDAGLAFFKDCQILDTLLLEGTAVTDAGLELVAEYQKLTTVNVKKSKITEAGVKKLSAALPKCTVEWDGGVIEPR